MNETTDSSWNNGKSCRGFVKFVDFKHQPSNHMWMKPVKIAESASGGNIYYNFCSLIRKFEPQYKFIIKRFTFVTLVSKWVCLRSKTVYLYRVEKSTSRAPRPSEDRILLSILTAHFLRYSISQEICTRFLLCCALLWLYIDFPISTRLTSLALWQSNDCPSASKATLMIMDKYFMWIHYERLHNHNKAKHDKTVCIFLGIYCMWSPQNDIKFGKHPVMD